VTPRLNPKLTPMLMQLTTMEVTTVQDTVLLTVTDMVWLALTMAVTTDMVWLVLTIMASVTPE